MKKIANAFLIAVFSLNVSLYGILFVNPTELLAEEATGGDIATLPPATYCGDGIIQTPNDAGIDEDCETCPADAGACPCVDADEDGYCSDEDCNDDNPLSWRTDFYYYDQDEDGYYKDGPNRVQEGSMEGMMAICYGAEIPEGYTETSNGEDCDDTDPTKTTDCSEESITINAYKVVCEDEQYLPNWASGLAPAEITDTTASDYVTDINDENGREVCWFESGWDFQWGFASKEGITGVQKLTGSHIGEADGTDSTGLCSGEWCGPNTNTGTSYSDWKTFGGTGTDGKTTVTISDFEGASGIWVREVLQEGYYPFTYPTDGPMANPVSAEIYCQTDIVNYDNYDQIENLDVENAYCVAFNVRKFKVNAYKVVCEDEQYLPNWASGLAPAEITDTTASDYVTDINDENGREVCWFESGWDFQWGFASKEGITGVQKLTGSHIGEADGTDSTGLCSGEWCGPNTNTGTGYSNWKTFEDPTDINGYAYTYITDFEGAPGIWVREVLKEGYQPFTYPTDGPMANPVSAEIYCQTDIVNYDNYDQVEDLTPDDVYCVAFNALLPEETTGSISGCKYNDVDGDGATGTDATIPGWEIELQTCPFPLVSAQLYTTASESINQIVGSCITVATTTTGDDGCYTFDNLTMDSQYRVQEVSQTGWTQTYPVSPTHYDLLIDGDITNIDFYNQEDQDTCEPSDEVCDGIDNDCDDEIDEGLECGSNYTYGCTDEEANNYNANADIDDGSCEYDDEEIPGCTDESANNYNANATEDDGSCTYGGGGTKTYCGDGIKNGSEECDGTDGVTSGYTCNKSCELEQTGNNTFFPTFNTGSTPASVPTPVVVLGEEGEPILEITKVVSSDIANQGDDVEYTVSVKNAGNMTAFNVVIDDTLPEGLTFVDSEGQTLSWELGDIEVDETKVITYTVNVSENAGDKIYTNVAVATADNFTDPVEASVDVEVETVEVLAATGFDINELIMLLFGIIALLSTSFSMKKFGARI